MTRPLWLWSLCTAILSVPGVAFACPYCAGRTGFTTATKLLVGALITLPYVIGWLVLRAVRRTSADLEPR